MILSRFRAFVDNHGRVFCAKLLQELLECQLIFDCLPSLPPSADRPSPGLRCRLISLVSFVNWPLSSLGPSFPPLLPVSREISSSSPSR